VSRRIRLGAQVAAVGVVAALLGLLAWKTIVGTGDEVTGRLAAGDRPQAPEFTLPRLTAAGTLSLSSYRGKVVLLNFWASWCLPCKEETPLLQRAWERWQRRGVVFIGVDAKDFRSDARSFTRRYGVTYPNVYDGKGSTLGRYGVTGFPETYFLDAQGRVVLRIAGPVAEAAEIDSGIERALART
jgi:cytochrome c biogenesis protein CcmG/thiol:disulfide interchange protein DsbE